MAILSPHTCNLGEKSRPCVVYKSKNAKTEVGLKPPKGIPFLVVQVKFALITLARCGRKPSLLLICFLIFLILFFKMSPVTAAAAAIFGLYKKC